MNEGYFEWLLKKACVTDDENGYSYICAILHEILFYPLVDMDENRWFEARRYRWDYASERGYSEVWQQDEMANQIDEIIGGCTALELLISLAERMHFETQDGPYEAPTGKWFEELIGNIGLETYTNRELNENEEAYFEADEKIQRMIFRQYRASGQGGLFPLRAPRQDQRGVELAIQLNDYLAENYDIL